MFLPAYFPDLNLIEVILDIMENWIQLHYDDKDKLSYDGLCQAVIEGYDLVTPNQLDELINSMNDIYVRQS